MTPRYVTLTVSLLALLVLVTAGGTARAVDLAEPTTWTGIKAGVLLPGSVELDEFEADQNTSFCLEFFSDFPMGDHFFYGPTIEILRMDWSANSDSLRLGESELMLNLSLNVKGLIPLLRDRVALRPGVGIGYGVMKRREDFNGTNYLTLKSGAELVVMIGSDRALLLDGGIWYAPTGGDSDTDIKIGPLTFLRAGITF